MEVILMERIEKLGQMGDVVTVKDGYARNFLLPQQKAMRATKANRERFETERAQLEAENLERRTEAESVAGKMDGMSVVLVRQAGDTGQLYGSVTARDVAQAVTDAGVTLAKRQVVMNRAIKTLGLYPIRVNLHPEVTVEVTVNVARSEQEAELQASGVDVVAAAQAELEGTDEAGEAAPEEDQAEAPEAEAPEAKAPEAEPAEADAEPAEG